MRTGLWDTSELLSCTFLSAHDRKKKYSRVCLIFKTFPVCSSSWESFTRNGSLHVLQETGASPGLFSATGRHLPSLTHPQVMGLSPYHVGMSSWIPVLDQTWNWGGCGCWEKVNTSTYRVISPAPGLSLFVNVHSILNSAFYIWITEKPIEEFHIHHLCSQRTHFTLTVVHKYIKVAELQP